MPGGLRVPAPVRSAVRTQVAVLLAWAMGGAGLAAALFPGLAAALFTLVMGTVIVVTLRTRLTFGLATAALGAVAFVFSDLVLAVVAVDPSVGAGSLPSLLAASPGDGAVWIDVVVAVVALMVSAGLADGVSGVIASAAVAGEATPATSTPPAIEGASRRGLEEAARELARAAHYRRPLALALVSVDAGGAEEPPAEVMAALDALLTTTLSRFETVCLLGPGERLLVLPEESPTDLRGGAAELCQAAAARVGHSVRMALAGFPEDGRDLDRILDRLRADLWASRKEEDGQAAGPVGRDHDPGGADAGLAPAAMNSSRSSEEIDTRATAAPRATGEQPSIGDSGPPAPLPEPGGP